jgi:ABC-type Mn2+/Zn2+ transport system permease subunit
MLHDLAEAIQLFLKALWPLLLISLLTSVVSHLFVRRYWSAVWIATAVSAVLFVGLGSYLDGRIDPFFPVALLTGACVAGPMAAIVGAFFSGHRDGAARGGSS